MAVFSRIKNWIAGEVLTASDLNAEFDNILNNMQPTGIEDASADVSAMQANTDPGGVGTESLATNLLGEIQRLRFVIKRLVGAQWYVDPGRSLQASSLGVQTGDIAANAVTRAKLASVGQQISGAVAIFSTSSTTPVDVTGLSVSITTTGRPVMILLINSGSGVSSITSSVGLSSSYSTTVCIVRDSTTLSQEVILSDGANISGTFTIDSVSIPVSSIHFIDPVAAGTYTYKIQMFRSDATGSSSIGNVKLAAYEL